jgi:MYXO-CTERM domain-containing protein
MSALRLCASALVTLGLVTLGARSARADDCPLGSVEKTERGATWCEPTVCDADMECSTGLVCRKVALCVEVGVLDKGAAKPDAAQRLLARQRCGAEQACPQNTTCSEKGRCVTRAQADKAALVAPGAAASAAPAGGTADPPKKACGCQVVGTSGGERAGGALAILGLAMVAARRARRGRRA